MPLTAKKGVMLAEKDKPFPDIVTPIVRGWLDAPDTSPGCIGYDPFIYD